MEGREFSFEKMEIEVIDYPPKMVGKQLKVRTNWEAGAAAH